MNTTDARIWLDHNLRLLDEIARLRDIVDSPGPVTVTEAGNGRRLVLVRDTHPDEFDAIHKVLRLRLRGLEDELQRRLKDGFRCGRSGHD